MYTKIICHRDFVPRRGYIYNTTTACLAAFRQGSRFVEGKVRDGYAPVLVITISMALTPVSTLPVDLIQSDYDFYVNNLNAILREL